MGTFDGVHRGHRRVISTAVERAREHGLRPMVVTFDPHPLRVLRPEDPPRVLTTTATKAELVAALGAKEMVAIPFTAELSRCSPLEFVEDVLVGALGVGGSSVGANFRFGHEARGDADLLRARRDFETTVVPLVEHDGGPFPRAGRKLVAAGDVLEAADLSAPLPARRAGRAGGCARA